MDHATFSYHPYFDDSEDLYPTSGCSQQGLERPLKFAGDYYAETDDIPRGLYMPTEPDLSLLGGGCEGKSYDLDAELDDVVTRGVYMPAPADVLPGGGFEQKGSGLDVEFDNPACNAYMPMAPADLSLLGGGFEQKGSGLDVGLGHATRRACMPLAPPDFSLLGGGFEKEGSGLDAPLDDVACSVYMPTAPPDLSFLGGAFEPKGISFDGELDDADMPTAPPNLSFLGGLEQNGGSLDGGFSNCRGDVDIPDAACQSSLGPFHCLNGVPGSPNSVGAAKDNNASCQPAIPRRFVEADCPAPLPSDPLFQLAATKLQLRDIAPYEIGNLVFDFLATRVKSAVRKVNFVKFTVKAEAFADGASCVLKTRTYMGECGVHTLEFQRRSGDCLAFGKAFRLAADFFSPYLAVSPEAPLEVPKARPPRAELGVAKDEGIDPLLDMAKSSSTALPTLHAEAADALSTLARDDQEASSLCNDRAFDGFKELVHSSQDSIAYPAACTLSALAECAEAAPYFVDRGILPVVADKIRSKATSTLVHRELVKALSTIAAKLPEEVSNEIMQSLTDDPAFGDALTQQQVQMASHAFEYRPTGALGAPSAAVVQSGGAGKLLSGSCALPQDVLAPRAR